LEVWVEVTGGALVVVGLVVGCLTGAVVVGCGAGAASVPGEAAAVVRDVPGAPLVPGPEGAAAFVLFAAVPDAAAEGAGDEG
jgi:hypothetical protein